LNWISEADTHNENVVCFPGVDLSEFEQPRDDAGHFNPAHVNISTEMSREWAWNVFDESATGNMTHPFDIDFSHECLHAFYIDACRLKQLVDDCTAAKVFVYINIIVGNEFPYQTVAVGMDTA